MHDDFVVRTRSPDGTETTQSTTDLRRAIQRLKQHHQQQESQYAREDCRPSDSSQRSGEREV